MDREHGEGGPKTTNDIVKERAGKPIGERHLQTEGKAEKAEGPIRDGSGKAMDAVREVVNEEKK